MNDLRASMRRLGDTLMELLQTRLELLNTELKEGTLAVFDALVLGATALVLMLLGLGCAVTFIVLASAPEYRLWVLGVATLLLAGAGWALVRQARSRLARPGGPFAASVAELARDRERFAAGE
ncbi:MAG: phage holin family protein [Burkholderiales bacterium]